MNRSFLFFGLVLLVWNFGSCRKDPAVELHPGNPGKLRVSVQNMFGDSLLELDTETYITMNAETLTCSLFKYYISNIVLTDVHGHEWRETESYHLLNQSDPASCSFEISGLPATDYVSMRFMIGVDSARNVSGSQTGALDPANDMFWTWSSGYIFAKLEGHSPHSSLASNMVIYHIGGFSGTYAGQRTVTIPFGSTNASVQEGHTPEIRLSADAGKWFGPNVLSIAETPSVNDPGPVTAGIADNYAQMFSLEEVRN